MPSSPRSSSPAKPETDDKGNIREAVFKKRADMVHFTIPPMELRAEWLRSISAGAKSTILSGGTCAWIPPGSGGWCSAAHLRRRGRFSVRRAQLKPKSRYGRRRAHLPKSPASFISPPASRRRGFSILRRPPVFVGSPIGATE